MRSPAELAAQLVRQWRNADLRQARLLADPDSYPIELPIGAPRPSIVASDLPAVGAHLSRWRAVDVGDVQWEERRYRRASDPVAVPVRWSLRSSDEWIMAAGMAPDRDATRRMRAELDRYRILLPAVHERFHPWFARHRATVADIDIDIDIAELIRVAELAATLGPGDAGGVPLRAMPLPGADTKLLERHSRTLTALLDLRFDGQVSLIGLERFLGAAPRNGHWLLVVDLDGGLLPYPMLRLTDHVIASHGLHGRHLLLVENEQCLHLLPPLRRTVAVLGAGNNVSWLGSPRLTDHTLIYWGDLDTWGLSILASARRLRPDLRPVLMDTTTFDTHIGQAVPEPRPATRPSTGLLATELELFDRLERHPTGRLEQERLPPGIVRTTLRNLWADELAEQPAPHADSARRPTCPS